MRIGSPCLALAVAASLPPGVALPQTYPIGTAVPKTQETFNPVETKRFAYRDGEFEMSWERLPFVEVPWQAEAVNNLTTDLINPEFLMVVRGKDFRSELDAKHEFLFRPHCDWPVHGTCRISVRLAIDDVEHPSAEFILLGGPEESDAALKAWHAAETKAAQEAERIRRARELALEAQQRQDQEREELALRRVEAAERRRMAELRVSCHRLYLNTANKRVGDLTVLQTKQIQACSASGLYE